MEVAKYRKLVAIAVCQVASCIDSTWGAGAMNFIVNGSAEYQADVRRVSVWIVQLTDALHNKGWGIRSGDIPYRSKWLIFVTLHS